MLSKFLFLQEDQFIIYVLVQYLHDLDIEVLFSKFHLKGQFICIGCRGNLFRVAVVFLNVMRKVHQIKYKVLEPQTLIVVEDYIDNPLIHLMAEIISLLSQITLLLIIRIP